MRCQLCLYEKKLIKAHIIPDFMYQRLYDTNHQITQFCLTETKYHKKKIPTGIYDKNILCKECDSNIIGPLEKYASIVIYGGAVKIEEEPKYQRMISQHNLESLLISNVDYNKFKLFLLSILWRGSISSNKLFDDVKLCKEQEEEIRKMLLNGNANEIDNYPCVLMTYSHTSLKDDLISQPGSNLSGNVFTYNINGLIFCYLLGKTPLFTKFVNQFSINKSNSFHIIQLKEKQAKKILNNLLGFDLY